MLLEMHAILSVNRLCPRPSSPQAPYSEQVGPHLPKSKQSLGYTQLF